MESGSSQSLKHLSFDWDPSLLPGLLSLGDQKSCESVSHQHDSFISDASTPTLASSKELSEAEESHQQPALPPGFYSHLSRSSSRWSTSTQTDTSTCEAADPKARKFLRNGPKYSISLSSNPKRKLPTKLKIRPFLEKLARRPGRNWDSPVSSGAPSRIPSQRLPVGRSALPPSCSGC